MNKILLGSAICLVIGLLGTIAAIQASNKLSLDELKDQKAQIQEEIRQLIKSMDNIYSKELHSAQCVEFHAISTILNEKDCILKNHPDMINKLYELNKELNHIQSLINDMR